MVNIFQVPKKERKRLEAIGCYPYCIDSTGVPAWFVDTDGCLWGMRRSDTNGREGHAVVRQKLNGK